VRIARALATGTLTVVLLLAACGDDADVETGDEATSTSTTAGAPPTLPDRPADITGTITSVVPFVPITEDCTPPEDLDPDGSVSSDDPPICTPEDNDVVGTVLVESQPGVPEGDKISFTVRTATVLRGADGSALDGLAALETGQVVEAWSTGMCAESYPEQCSAVAIRRTS
jgi:hypothetical protein